MSKVVNLPGAIISTSDPNQTLVEILESLLEKAKSGEIQSFVGTGFTNTGLRVTLWADYHKDVYQMLGAITWLQSEYVDRHVEG